MPAQHTCSRKKLQVTLAGERDAEDSVEGYGEKEHPSLGNQASSAMLLKKQCVSHRKKDTKLLLQVYFPKAGWKLVHILVSYS